MPQGEFCSQHQVIITELSKRVPIWIFIGAMAVVLVLTSITFTTLRIDIRGIQSTVTAIDRKVVELDTKMDVMRSYSKYYKDEEG